MSYLKSASSNLLTCKVSFNNKKTLNSEPKIPYLSIFEQELKKLLSYLKSAASNLSICKILEKKTITSKFGTKNTFFGIFG